MLLFDEATHAYTLDGVVLPSVTQVMKPLVNFDGVPPGVLENASNYGRAVHKMVALELLDLLDYATLDEALYPALEAFGAWRRDHVGNETEIPWAKVEQPMYHKRLKYAGTPDILFDGEYIIDIKTRKPDKLKDSIQCAAYEHLHLANGGTKAKYEHRILFLDPKGGYEFVKVNHREAWGRFRLMLDTHKNNSIIQSWRD